MKNKILCYIYENMADFEISLLLHRLRNTGKRDITFISEEISPIRTQSGLTCLPEAKISDIQDISSYEALIIPGGPINNEQNAICETACQMISSGRLVAAICFAPQFLGRAGILDHYQYTTSCSPEKIKQLGVSDPYPRQNYIMARCVTDRNLITAQGYAFVDFALCVCDYLHIFENETQRYEQLLRVKE